MQKMLTLVAAVALVAGCATAPQKTSADANAAIAAAVAVTKQAHAAGYEWRDTGKIIKKAEAAAAKKDYDVAVKLAVKAEHQSQNALKQAEAQKNAGMNSL